MSSERERLVRDLGDHEAMILRNHGLLVVGRTVPAAFNVLFRLERACEVQVMALSCNTKLIYPPQDVMEETFDKMRSRTDRPARNGELAWPALSAQARPHRSVVSELTLNQFPAFEETLPRSVLTVSASTRDAALPQLLRI